MKNRKVRGLISVFFALTMALSTGALLAKAKANKPVEIVLAEGESETPEQTPETPEEQPAEQPIEQEETPAEQPSESEQSNPITPKNIFMIFANAFRDAIKDLIRHIKSWFKRG